MRGRRLRERVAQASRQLPGGGVEAPAYEVVHEPGAIREWVVMRGGSPVRLRFGTEIEARLLAAALREAFQDGVLSARPRGYP